MARPIVLIGNGCGFGRQFPRPDRAVDGVSQDTINTRRGILSIDAQQPDPRLSLGQFVADLEEQRGGDSTGRVACLQGVEDSAYPNLIGFSQIHAAMEQGHFQESFHEVSLEYGDSSLGHFLGGLGLGFSDGSGC